MPNPTYRRYKRNRLTGLSYIQSRRFYINKPIQFPNNGVNGVNGVNGNGGVMSNRLETVYQYFYDLVEAISQHLELQTIISKANQIISIFSEKEQVYKVIDIIENTILSIVTNIYEFASVGIIQSRLEYLKGLLMEIPDSFDDYGQFGCMLLDIINGIIDGFDFTSVIHSIGVIQKEMADDVVLLEKLDVIHETLFSIIQNISEGVSFGILDGRVTYLKKLIGELGC